MFDIPIHILVIHFPIALIIIAAIYDSWGVYSKRPEMNEAGYGLTLWSAVAALAAVATGLQLAGVTRVDRAAVTPHAGFGIAAGIVITALGVARYSARTRGERQYRIVWLALEWAAAVLVFTTAITGHRL